MAVSVFDLFSIGVGPSSSHTVGPMRAAKSFVEELGERVSDVAGVCVDLYGSLAATGRGHGTLGAVLLGLAGESPETVDPEAGRERVAAIDGGEPLLLGGVTLVAFTTADIGMHPTEIKNRHTNAMRFAVDFADGGSHEAMYYSIGGGFVVRDGQPPEPPAEVPWRFTTGDELLKLCYEQHASMWEIMWRNECAVCCGSGRRWSTASTRASTPRECCRAASRYADGRPGCIDS